MKDPRPGDTAPFSDVYGRLLEEFAREVGERESRYGQPSRSVREELVRCIWFGGHVSPEGLAVDDGRRLEVVSPGWWNVEGGPDFARAELLLEGAGRVVGDVEVHTLASSWYGHGHHRQPEYNDVALHVVMWNDREEPTVEAESGDRIPQLTLSRVVEEDLEELVEIFDAEGETVAAGRPAAQGRYCSRAAQAGELNPQWVGRLLDAAGDHRLLSRARSAAALLQDHPPDQMLYERVAEALGYKQNRMPFLQLAGILPLETLRQAVPADAPPEARAEALEAAFLTVGGLLGEPDPEEDDETRQLRDRLQGGWRGLGLEPKAMLSGEHWRLAGTRPVNYPSRRLAALALLCGRHLHEGLFRHFLRRINSAAPGPRQRLEVAVRRALTGCFTGLSHPYWSYRYALGGRRLGKARALVGEGRAISIVVDALLPLLVAHARREEDAELMGRLHGLWAAIPRRQENAVTRRMQKMLFRDAEAARSAVGSARRQQGLHQIYRDCCRAAAPCDRCVVYLARQSGKTLVAP